MKAGAAASHPEFEARLAKALELVAEEVRRAASMHPPMHSPHEAYAVLLEEVDELWFDIKRNEGLQPHAMIEAKQVGAMALRYIIDLG